MCRIDNITEYNVQQTTNSSNCNIVSGIYILHNHRSTFNLKRGFKIQKLNV